ncbi:hypothetical protein CCR75_002491 [Bremia lactucae]|uniref:RxLR effector protein n=1 Tax=Bremia lactucae TaxID=4779 RepID=A0A976FR63_BRELC|nr:hypothetical protein CCR75_002491 [Bremia lactucae]
MTKYKCSSLICSLLLLSCYHVVTSIESVALIEAPVLGKSRQLRSSVELVEGFLLTSDKLAKVIGTLPKNLAKESLATFKWGINHFKILLAEDKVAAAGKIFPDDSANPIMTKLFESDAFLWWEKLIRRTVDDTQEEVDTIITSALVTRLGKGRAIKLFTEAGFEADAINAKWLALLYHALDDEDMPKLLKEIVSSGGIDKNSVEFFIKLCARENNKDAAYEIINSLLQDKKEYREVYQKFDRVVETYRTKWDSLKSVYFKAVSDPKLDKSVSPMQRLRNLYQTEELDPVSVASKIADIYAKTSEGLHLLQIVKQTLHDKAATEADKAFAGLVLDKVHVKWIQTNYDVGKMLKSLTRKIKPVETLLNTSEGVAFVFAIREMKATESEGYSEAVGVFRKTFEADVLEKMIKNANSDDTIVAGFIDAYIELMGVKIA